MLSNWCEITFAVDLANTKLKSARSIRVPGSKAPKTYCHALFNRNRTAHSGILFKSALKTLHNSSYVWRDIRKLGFHNDSIPGETSSTSSQFCGLGHAHTLLLQRASRFLPRLYLFTAKHVRKKSMSISEANEGSLTTFWLIIWCKLKQNMQKVRPKPFFSRLLRPPRFVFLKSARRHQLVFSRVSCQFSLA